MREIVLDTETTGFDPMSGDRIVEIGCIELKNHIPTGEIFHAYINPERDMPEGAYKVHGLSAEFLSTHPKMEHIVGGFLEFIEDSPLVIHNAKFDMKFINAELRWQALPEIPFARAIDTLTMARKLFPGAPATLDALCKRFKIDNTGRHKHGALIDSELLAEVYLELIGGRQTKFTFDANKAAEQDQTTTNNIERIRREPRSFAPSTDEEKLHREMLEKLQDSIFLKNAG